MDKLILDKDAVTYDSDGSARIDYQKTEQSRKNVPARASGAGTKA